MAVVSFFYNVTPTTEIYSLSLHDALPICPTAAAPRQTLPSPRTARRSPPWSRPIRTDRSEEHTSELQSLAYLVCRLLLEKKKHEKEIKAEKYFYIKHGASFYFTSIAEKIK